MFDYIFDSHDIYLKASQKPFVISGGPVFWAAKRAFDIAVSLLLLPVVVLFALLLVILNPVWNQGPLFFIQTRMGKHCRPFRTVKFRSMQSVAEIRRGPEDPVEEHRITRLGHVLRCTRIDELPQILNVLKGEMSLIGPRPDFFDHAASYLVSVPGYRERHVVRPGISGLAQVAVGYVATSEGTKSKTEADLYYIENAGFALDTRLALQTIYTIFARRGT